MIKFGLDDKYLKKGQHIKITVAELRKKILNYFSQFNSEEAMKKTKILFEDKITKSFWKSFSINSDNIFAAIINDRKISKFGLKKSNIHLPDANTKMELVKRNAISYGKKIQAYLDDSQTKVVVFAGIGKDPAHIAFNDFITEKEFKTNISHQQKNTIALQKNTRVVKLSNGTRKANARFFSNKIENVPTHAVTIGFYEILQADNVIVMANGDEKSQAIAKSLLCSEVSYKVPASLLKLYRKEIHYLLDNKAYSQVDKVKHLKQTSTVLNTYKISDQRAQKTIDSKVL